MRAVQVLSLDARFVTPILAPLQGLLRFRPETRIPALEVAEAGPLYYPAVRILVGLWYSSSSYIAPAVLSYSTIAHLTTAPPAALPRLCHS